MTVTHKIYVVLLFSSGYGSGIKREVDMKDCQTGSLELSEDHEICD